jgi:hypothetical protein
VGKSGLDAFDDAQVALRRIPQGSKCGLVARAVMRGDRLGEAVELDQYGTLIDASLISLGRATSGEEAPTAGEDGRNGQLVYSSRLAGSEIER